MPKSGYTPTFNGCGSDDSEYIPDNPMLSVHKLDPVYLSLHGITDGDYTESCNNHDICYGTCLFGRNSCDVDFRRQLREVCFRDYSSVVDLAYLAECLVYAETYFIGVQTLGKTAHENGQRNACNCCY